MLGIIKAGFRTVRLFFMRRRQFDNVKIRAYFRKFDIEVGMYSYGCFDRWRMPGPLRIGRYCSIAGTVRVIPVNHPVEAITTHPALYERTFGVIDHDIHGKAPLVIGDDVWIGHNAIILPGCKHIGRGAIIGAGAVVTRDVLPYAIVAGNPARKLRDRYSPELAAAIDASQWWKLDIGELAELVRTRRDLVYHPTVEAFAEWTGSPGAKSGSGA